MRYVSDSFYYSKRIRIIDLSEDLIHKLVFLPIFIIWNCCRKPAFLADLSN
jgi:hypothetical protein